MNRTGVLAAGLLLAASRGQAASPAPAGTPVPGAGVTAATKGWFPFVVPGLEASPTAVSLAPLNEAPAGRAGRVTIREGHFADGHGARIRFFGVNLTATAALPDPADAPRLAARLRKAGVNLVRLHFLDIPAPDGLTLPDRATLDPAQVDRFDDLLAALKAEGIYVNVNLHVARQYPGLEGDAAKRFDMGKMVDRFYPPFVEAQKAWARALLTRVNPRTGTTLAKDPGVLCVELNNENTLLPSWFGGPDRLPEPFAAELARQWRAWLKKKYMKTPVLKAAWADGERPAGSERLRNAGLTAGTLGWEAQSSGGAEALLAVLAGPPPLLRWEARKPGTESWHLQLMQAGLEFRGGEEYLVSFRARAGAPVTLAVSTMLNAPPWTELGLAARANLTTAWQEFAFPFRAGDTGGARGRLNFSLGNHPGLVELADLSLKLGGRTGLSASESIEAYNVALRAAGGTPGATRDAWAFLIDAERATTRDLVRFLKTDLGVEAPIADTQASYGEAAGVWREGTLADFTDMHGYWQHPDLGTGWGDPNWTIGNTSQVLAANGGTLAEMARYRVTGRPFTVSEYNIPNPSDYAAETLPMYAAFAAFQDWDAIYAYTWMDFKRDYAADHLAGFFDITGQPAKLVFAPAAALAFRHALVAPGGTPVTLTLPQGGIPRLWAEGRAALPGLWNAAGVPGGAAAIRRLEIRLAPGEGAVTGSEPVSVPDRRMSDTGEMEWEPGGATPQFTVNAPAFRMVAGPVSRRTIELGDVTLAFDRLGFNYACAALVALDENPVRTSRRLLVSVAGRVENQSMGWKPGRQSVGHVWGHGPTVAERVPVTLTLPGVNWKVVALDGAGAPQGRPLATHPAATGTRVQLGTGKSPTLWYLLTR